MIVDTGTLGWGLFTGLVALVLVGLGIGGRPPAESVPVGVFSAMEPTQARDVAIMTDTDNTEGAVTAYYGDIRFRSPTADSTADE